MFVTSRRGGLPAWAPLHNGRFRPSVYTTLTRPHSFGQFEFWDGITPNNFTLNNIFDKFTQTLSVNCFSQKIVTAVK